MNKIFVVAHNGSGTSLEMSFILSESLATASIRISKFSTLKCEKPKRRDIAADTLFKWFMHTCIDFNALLDGNSD